MKSYNGFTPEQRTRAQRWLNEQWSSGIVERPKQCAACGQTGGIFDAHAEDYSEPFGPHIYAWPLCYVCHMMLHCRFGEGAPAFHRYVSALEAGCRSFAATSRNFDAIRRLLNYDEKAWTWTMIPVRSPRTIPLLSDLVRETPGMRDERVRGYHESAAA